MSPGVPGVGVLCPVACDVPVAHPPLDYSSPWWEKLLEQAAFTERWIKSSARLYVKALAVYASQPDRMQCKWVCVDF